MPAIPEKAAPWAPFAAILLLAAGLRWLAFSLFDITHADELMQYVEQGHRLAFGHGLVPWEYRYGIRSLLVPDLLAAPMAIARWFAPQGLAPLIAARTLFAALCLGAVPAAFWLGSLQSRLHALAAMFVAAVWAESVLMGVQALSEPFATAAGCAGTAALLRSRDQARAAFLAGFLLALMVLLRMQYAAYGAPLALMVLGRNFAAWRRVIAGALPALAIGAAVDLAAGMAPFAWIGNNFRMNIGDGRSTWFGVADSAAYLHFIAGRMFPAAIPVALLALASGKAYRPVLIAAIVNIAAHSVIAHKEYRFIWLSIFLIVVLAAIGSVSLMLRLREERGARAATLPMAMGALCLGWAALSIVTYQLSGGVDSFRKGRHFAESALEAARRPGTCGIALPSWHRQHLAPAYLPRRVELFLLPDDADRGRAPFPQALTAAADALILTGRAAPPAPYRLVRCRQGTIGKACLWLREGGCRTSPASAAFTYQAVMEADDM